MPLINNVKLPVIWDFNDHPGQFDKIATWADQEFTKFLIDKNSTIISSSIGITNYLNNKYERSAYTIPNGVDLAKFHKKISKNNLNQKPVIGYVGIISSWFFDFELVKKVAIHFSSYEIHLYGPCVSNVKEQLDEMLQISNISYFGEQPYDMLPKVMETFRVGIIPLYSIPEVWRLASGKLLQYLGVGIPVVSVWMDQYSKIKNNVFLAKTHSEFIGSLEKALKHSFIPMADELNMYDWRYLSIEFRNELEEAIESFN